MLSGDSSLVMNHLQGSEPVKKLCGPSVSAGHCRAARPAPLCRKAGGEPEQIQLLLGYASIQTTERYLGTEQNLTTAVNDALGLELE
jgi:integrase/recombinase XerD